MGIEKPDPDAFAKSGQTGGEQHESDEPVVTDVLLGDGPHEFLMWCECELLEHGDPGEVWLASEVVKEHKRWCASGATVAERCDVDQRNARQFNIYLSSTRTIATEGAQLLRDQLERASKSAVPLPGLNDGGRGNGWFILTVQRREPEGHVPKLGVELSLEGSGMKDIAPGEWWIVNVRVAEPDAYFAICELVEWISHW